MHTLSLHHAMAPASFCRRHTQRIRRNLAGALAVLAALLQGCGGAAGDAQAPPPVASLPELAGRVTNGVTVTDVGALQITVKGNVGTARTAEGRLAPIDGSDYLASLDRLSGPYLLSDSARSPAPDSLYSVATAPGTANLTPLTTLLVAELLGTEPSVYFEALGSRGGFTAADEASLAAAEQRVRRFLKREYAFDIPAGIGNFVTARFTSTAGDPMFDTITALVARIGTGGDYSAVVTALAQESGRCKVERVGVAAAGDTDDFCPFSKRNEVDADDATVRVLSFDNRRGDRLTVRLRGASLIGVQLRTAAGLSSSCAGAACSGVSIGTPAGDQTQTVTFSATPLGGAGGAVALSGSLRSAAPGVPLPGLPCTSNRFYLIHPAAGTAEGYCATPDDFGLGAAGQSAASGASRRSYTFNDGADGPYLELVTQGSNVVRALVFVVDPVSGARALFQCRGGACPGVSLGAATVDDSLGVPIVKQPIRFNQAVLAAVLPDGSLSGTASVTLEATLTGFYVNDPSVLPMLPVACPAEAPAVLARPSDQTQPVRVCEPADTQGFTLRSTGVDGDGNLFYTAAGLLADGVGSYSSGHTVSLSVTPAGTVVAVVFEQFGGPRYQCLAAACAGVSLSAPNGAGERTVRFTATVLHEQGTAGLVADRRAILDGSMVGLPPP